MNTKLEEYKNDIRNKRVAILGIGISNTPLIKYLAGLGVQMTAFDRADRHKLSTVLKNFEGLDMEFSLGEKYLDNLVGFDVIFRTPGMRFDLPELQSEVARGARLTSEMETFMELCPAKILAVTGSDGKTTTTTLIHEMLKMEGYRCWLGGNIGTPLLDRIDDISPEDMVVLELSSFQLHTMKSSPQIAVVTNLAPNHLDIHKSMEEYVDAKKQIFIHGGKTSKLIINFDNDITKGFQWEAPGEVVFFSRQNPLHEGVSLKGNMLTYTKDGMDYPIIRREDIFIPGDHNIENYLAAIGAVYDFVSVDTIKKVATSFKGVTHRIEPVRELHGIRFYNDSIGSSPSRTIASLKAFGQKVILIAGGYDKKIPYDPMGEIIADKVKVLVLVGATGPKIENAYMEEMNRRGTGEIIPILRASTLPEAVKIAYDASVQGDIVILSPASASFDMFKNFEERGNRFKEIVMSLE